MDFVKFEHTQAAKINFAYPLSNHNKCNQLAYSEQESMEFLYQENILGVTPANMAKNEEEAIKFAKQQGYPVVIKINSPDILHKSDIGGVRLNIQNEQEVRQAYNEIINNAKKHCPNANIHGVTINKMRDTGIEFMIGMKNNNQYGPMIMVGLGGIFVELFKDTTLSPAPISKEEAKKMLLSLKSSPLLTGYRGNKPCDIESLVELIYQFSNLCIKYKDEITEIDLNPVFVYEKGIAVVDALIVKSV